MSISSSPTFKIVPSFKRSEPEDYFAATSAKDLDLRNSPQSRSPNYRRPADVRGYTGHLSDFDPTELHVLERPYERPSPVKGYSGHIPISKLTRSNFNSDLRQDTTQFAESRPPEQLGFGKGLDRQERYEAAIDTLLGRGQSQNMLMRIVQAKLSERVRSYAEQQIWLRNLFSSFHKGGSGEDGLSELELRNCLETMNIQFDDCQFLALFAFFDDDFSGTIDFNEFSKYAMIPNPKGGTAILTKPITSPMGSDTWTPIKLKQHEDDEG